MKWWVLILIVVSVINFSFSYGKSQFEKNLIAEIKEFSIQENGYDIKIELNKPAYCSLDNIDFSNIECDDIKTSYEFKEVTNKIVCVDAVELWTIKRSKCNSFLKEIGIEKYPLLCIDNKFPFVKSCSIILNSHLITDYTHELKISFDSELEKEIKINGINIEEGYIETSDYPLNIEMNLKNYDYELYSNGKPTDFSKYMSAGTYTIKFYPTLTIKFENERGERWEEKERVGEEEVTFTLHYPNLIVNYYNGILSVKNPLRINYYGKCLIYNGKDKIGEVEFNNDVVKNLDLSYKEGENDVYIFCYNNIGQYGYYYFSKEIDSEKPEIKIISPVQGESYSKLKLIFEISDEHDVSYKVYLNGKLIEEGNEKGKKKVTYNNIKEENELKIVACDSFKNCNEKIVYFNKEKEIKAKEEKNKLIVPSEITASKGESVEFKVFFEGDGEIQLEGLPNESYEVIKKEGFAIVKVNTSNLIDFYGVKVKFGNITKGIAFNVFKNYEEEKIKEEVSNLKLRKEIVLEKIALLAAKGEEVSNYVKELNEVEMLIKSRNISEAKNKLESLESNLNKICGKYTSKKPNFLIAFIVFVIAIAFIIANTKLVKEKAIKVKERLGKLRVKEMKIYNEIPKEAKL